VNSKTKIIIIGVMMSLTMGWYYEKILD